ncbi:MAG: Maf family protein [Acidimicrobiia bacterium]
MAPARRLVLASASPARARLLRHAGFAPEVVASGVDEAAYLDGSNGSAEPSEVVVRLAVAKAEEVASRPETSGAVVVACDSLLDVDGVAYGKPGSTDEAAGRLWGLRGATAVLCTGHCVIETGSGARAAEAAATEVHFGEFSAEELHDYLDTGEALGVAGGFTLDGYFAPFVDGISGDHGNVIGLSLPVFRRLLGVLGVSVTDLWDR